MKAIINEELCVGCGPCADICPDVFELIGDKAKVKMNPIPASLINSCKEAAEACPTTAITIQE